MLLNLVKRLLESSPKLLNSSYLGMERKTVCVHKELLETLKSLFVFSSGQGY